MRENFSVQGTISEWLKISVQALRTIGASKITQDPKYARLMAEFSDGSYLLLNMRRKEAGRLLFEFDATSSALIAKYKSAAAAIYRKQAASQEQHRQERRIQHDSMLRAQAEKTSAENQPMQPIGEASTKPVERSAAKTIPNQTEPTNTPSRMPVTPDRSPVKKPMSEQALRNETSSAAPISRPLKRRNPSVHPSHYHRDADEKSFTQMYDPDELDFIEQTQYLDTPSSKKAAYEQNDKTGDLLAKVNRFADQLWVIWIALILVPPLGLFMLWYYKRMKFMTRMIVSVVIFVYMLLIWLGFFGIDTGLDRQTVQAWYNDARATVQNLFRQTTGTDGNVKPTDRSDEEEIYSYYPVIRYAYGEKSFLVS